MPRVVHFEFSADDPERATQFFKDAFDWEIQTPMPDYHLAKTGEGMGIDGAIMDKAMGHEKRGRTTVTIGVENLEETTKRIEQAGGKLEYGPGPIPGIGHISMFTDPEGSIYFCVLEPDESAGQGASPPVA
jgi:predicted enzyme related to lactoylglutathione lyase